jgi:hypothetical protein
MHVMSLQSFTDHHTSDVLPSNACRITAGADTNTMLPLLISHCKSITNLLLEVPEGLPF